MGKHKASALINLDRDEDELYNRVDSQGRPRAKKDYKMLVVLLDHLIAWQKRVRASQVASKFRKSNVLIVTIELTLTNNTIESTLPTFRVLAIQSCVKEFSFE